MRELREIMAELAASGLSPEQQALVMELTASVAAASGAEREAARTPRQKRNRRYYEAKTRLKASENRLKASDSDVADASPPKTKVSPRPLSKTQPLDPSLSPPYGGTFPSLPKPGSEFARFWEHYPRKIGKRSAETAFRSAMGRAGGDEAAITILAGLMRATRSAAWRRDPQFIPHPATWLNRDGWLDELDGAKFSAPQPDQTPPPEAMAHLVAHYRETGEWKPSWGPPPEVGADVLPFRPAPSDRIATG